MDNQRLKEYILQEIERAEHTIPMEGEFPLGRSHDFLDGELAAYKNILNLLELQAPEVLPPTTTPAAITKHIEENKAFNPEHPPIEIRGRKDLPTREEIREAERNPIFDDLETPAQSFMDEARMKVLNLTDAQYHELLEYERMPNRNWPVDLRNFIADFRARNEGLTDISVDVAIAAFIKRER